MIIIIIISLVGLLFLAESEMTELINPNPVIYQTLSVLRPEGSAEEWDDGVQDEIDAFEVFEHIRGIHDPEHPHTLEELKVVQHTLLYVDNKASIIDVQFTPTIPHCSMSTLIGLCIRVKLLRSLPSRFKLRVRVSPGSHAQEAEVNKQLNDKERVAAALENKHLIDVVDKCLAASVRE
eukprot:ANDGO_06654.mRNA.1 Protein AE7